MDDLTCTDVEQQWGALKVTTLKEYEAKKMTELCHVTSQKKVYSASMPEVTAEMEERWKDRLTRCKRNK